MMMMMMSTRLGYWACVPEYLCKSPLYESRLVNRKVERKSSLTVFVFHIRAGL